MDGSPPGPAVPGVWDIAVTPAGPIIVEINTHPGADGLQTPYLPEKKGARHVIARFLGETASEVPEKKEEPAAAPKERNRYIEEVSRKSGWTYEEAAKRMKAAKKLTGITFSDYNKHDFHLVPEEEQEEAYANIKEKQERKIKAKNEKYIGIVMKYTGWEHDYADEMMRRSKEATGVSYEHYAAFNFWELTEAQQKTYFVKGDAEQLRKIYNKDPKLLRVFINKDQFASAFEKYLGRAWIYTTDMDLATFREKFRDDKKIIYKPRASSGGSGVTVFDISEETVKDVFDTLSSMPEGIVESYVIQHPEMKKLSLNSVQ